MRGGTDRGRACWWWPGARRRPRHAAPAASRPATLADKVTADGMYVHLEKLADIATANGDSRADGTPGYRRQRRLRRQDVARQGLRRPDAGVRAARHDVAGAADTGRSSGRSFPVDQASPLVTTPAGGLSARRPCGRRSRPVAAAGDYGSVDVRGAFADRRRHRAVRWSTSRTRPSAEGAVGVLVVSDPGADGSPAGLFTPGYYQQLTSPGRRDRRGRRRGAAPHDRARPADPGREEARS